MSELKYKGDTMYLGDKVDLGGVTTKVIDDSEFMEVETDSEDRILGGRKSDGKKFENVGFEAKAICIDGNTIETMDNPGFIEATVDAEGKILSGTTTNGEGIVGGVNVNQLRKDVDAIDFTEIEKEVSEAIKRMENESVPEYYFDNDYLPNKIRKIEELRANSGVYSDVFLFITDTHTLAYHGNSMNSLPLVKYILKNSSIKKVINGGDIVGSWCEDLGPVYQDMANTQKLISTVLSCGADYIGCRGNHDLIANTWDGKVVTFHDGIKPVGTWDFFVGQLAAVNNRIHFNKQDLDKAAVYFYYDNDASLLRYICIDEMITTQDGDLGFELSKEQVDYLYDAVVNAPQGYKIVFFTHIYPVEYDGRIAATHHFIKAAANKEELVMHNTTYDFSNAADVVFSLNGHKHQDEIIYFNNCLFVTTGSDAWPQENERYFYKHQYPVHHELNSVTAQLFDLFFIDYANKIVESVRIGVGGDRKMHLDVININAGDTYVLNTSLSGNITWVISDSIGHTEGSAGWDQTSNYASIDNGLVTAISRGQSTVAAIDKNGNFEFWGINIK